MNTVTKVAYDRLLTEGRITEKEWASDLARATGLSFHQAKAAIRRSRPSVIKTINRNGMSVWPQGADGKAAVGGRGRRCTALVRMDHTDDPDFLRFQRHLAESAGGSITRVRDDMWAAVNRGQVTSGPALVALSAVTTSDPVREVLLLTAGKKKPKAA